MVSDSTRYTIVIPTRERCETLQYTLKTCVTQDYDNLDIIVSDNFSQDDTRAVVESFKDKRIRYLNTGKRVGMSTNWEFALSHVKDGYVTYIGDDDGFLPNAIRNIAAHIQEQGNVSAFAWGRAVYNWPSHVRASQRNTLFTHMDKRLLHLISDEWLRRLASFQCPWASLPSIYNSFVNMDVVTHIKGASAGRFFNSAIPDVYSAIVIASTIYDYYFSMRPYAIAGISAKSTGNSFSNMNLGAGPAERFLSENEIPIHPRMVMSSLSTVCVAECLMQIRDLHLLPEGINIDVKVLIRASLLEASEEPRGEYPLILQTIRQVAAKNGLSDFAETIIEDALYSPRIESEPMSARDLRHNGIVLNCSTFNVNDVYEATLLCEHVLNSGRLSYLFPVGTMRTTVMSYIPPIIKRVKRIFRRKRSS